MQGRERERSGPDETVPDADELCIDGGRSIEAETCRDLVADDRHEAAWVGVVTDESVESVAAAGTDATALSDVVVSIAGDTDGVVARAVATGDHVVTDGSSDSTPDAGDTPVDGAAPVRPDPLARALERSSSTVAVPFEYASVDADGVLVVHTTVSEVSVGERRTLSTLAATLGRDRSRTAEGPSDRVDTPFREAFARHDAVMLLIDPETGRILTANDAAAAFYGYDRETLGQMAIRDINTATPEEVAAERECARREERNYFVFEHELASGERRTVEVHSTPIPLDDGSVLFSVIHDVTERVEYERELERYGELFENVPVGLFRSRPGPDGRFEEVNPALVEMFGADSRRELLDTDPSALYVDDDARVAFSEDLLADGVVEEREHELRRLDGETFWGSLSAIRTQTADGPVFDGIVLDVSERRTHEAALERQNERMEVLNQLLRHDIRNDMAVIGGTLDLLERSLTAGESDADSRDDSDSRDGVDADPRDESGSRDGVDADPRDDSDSRDGVDGDPGERIATLRERADHVVELTHTARNITESLSIESGEQPEATPVRVDQVLADELENARSSYPDASFELTTSVPAVEVSATELLDSVFRNLFNNAVQHNDTATPTVTVDVTVEAETVTVTVADDGPGVPDAQKSRVFERGEKGTASSGTGLGLYLVGSLVEQYGGDIEIRDNDPRGAVFEVTLQRADPAERDDEADDPFGGVAR